MYWLPCTGNWLALSLCSSLSLSIISLFSLSLFIHSLLIHSLCFSFSLCIYSLFFTLSLFSLYSLFFTLSLFTLFFTLSLFTLFFSLSLSSLALMIYVLPCSACGSFDDAYAVFESMEQRNTVTYTHIMKALGARKEGSKALQLFNQMKSEGHVPDAKCYQVILVACSHSGLVDEGINLFKQMKDQGITPDVYHYNALVDLFARVGRLDEAEKVIEEMPVKPTRVTWAIVLNGCRTTNDVERAERIAEKLFEMDPKKHSTYTLLVHTHTLTRTHLSQRLGKYIHGMRASRGCSKNHKVGAGARGNAARD